MLNKYYFKSTMDAQIEVCVVASSESDAVFRLEYHVNRVSQFGVNYWKLYKTEKLK